MQPTPAVQVSGVSPTRRDGQELRRLCQVGDACNQCFGPILVSPLNPIRYSDPEQKQGLRIHIENFQMKADPEPGAPKVRKIIFNIFQINFLPSK